MSFLPVLLIAVLLVILSLAAYVDRVYSEMGKFLAREYQDNVDSWEERVEPRLKLGRESIAQSASVLRQLSLASVALSFGLRVSEQAHGGDGFWTHLGLAIFWLIGLILIFDRLIPQVLFARTRG